MLQGTVQRPHPAGHALLADAAALLALLGFALAVVAPVLTGRVPVATDTLGLWGPPAAGLPPAVHNAALADSALQNLPWQIFVRRSLAGGEWPLWDPDLFAGYPFLGNGQNQLYYPVAWLLLLLPLGTAIGVNVVLHLWLAGAGMYLLSRVLGASRGGSVLAGLAFAASGQVYTVLEMTGATDIYVWLPWVLAAGEMAWRRRSWALTAGAGLLFGVLAVAGHLPWFLYSSLFLALWFAARVGSLAWDTWRGRTPRGQVAGQATRAAALLAWGPALAAIHLLPFAELSALSSRLTAAGPPLGADALDRTVRLLARQMRLFVPQFYGTPVGNIGAGLDFNNCWYVGLAPLALALVALLLRRERKVWFLGASGLAAFGVAAGLPGLDQLHRLPGLQAQLPERTAYLFIVAAAALSGLGFDAFLALAQRRSAIAAGLVWLLGLGALAISAVLGAGHAQAAGDVRLYDLQTAALRQALLVTAGLLVWSGLALALRGGARPRGHAILAGALLGLTAVDLLTYAPGFNTFVPAESLAPQAPTADVMRADRTPWRMLAPDSPGPLLVPNEARIYGLHDVQGYDSQHLARYEAFWAAGDPSVGTGGYFNVMLRPQAYRSAQAALLNVVYVVTAAPWAPGARPPGLTPVYEGAGAVYRNAGALPRAFTVRAAEVVPAAAIPARLAAAGFDPQRAVLIEQAPPPGFGVVPAGGGTSRGSAPGPATITRYRNLRVDVTAQMDHAGWLVLGDVNYPGWEATVDGQPAPLYTAYGLVRAVPLPAGAHQVVFAFHPASVRWGGAISGLALLAALGVLGAGVRRSPRRRGGG